MEKQSQAEACLKQALLYLHEEQNGDLVSSYNLAIGITNEVYKSIGDTHLVKSDIGKLKDIRNIIDRLAKHDTAEVRFLAKGLAELLTSLLV